MQKELAVLLACHNRRQKTLDCISNLINSANERNLPFSLYLFDDGSSDGTAEAINNLLPDAVILQGDGSYFWNRSMYAAFAKAMAYGHNQYLWLNDDTMLNPKALDVLIATSQDYWRSTGSEAIVVGAICDSKTGALTYGGGIRQNPTLRPFNYQLLKPNGHAQLIEVMNGNVVLIPDRLARALGNLDPVFEHGMGDTDYALRACSMGKSILLTPEYVGTCSRNPLAGTFHDAKASIATRFRFALSRKGLPWKSWLALCYRHGGVLWPLHFLWGYMRIIISARKG